MKVAELLNEGYLNEAQLNEVDEFIDSLATFLLSEDEGGDMGGDVPVDGSPVTEPTVPPKDPGPNPPYGPNAGLWLRTLMGQLGWLLSATKISKRLKQIGVKGEGAKRVKKSALLAKQNIARLFSNPGWRPAPQFKFEPGKAPKPLNKPYMIPVKMKEEMHSILATELRKIPPHLIHQTLEEGWKSAVVQTALAGAMAAGIGAAVKHDHRNQKPAATIVDDGVEREYAEANGKSPGYYKAKEGEAIIDGKKTKVRYWKDRHMKYTYYYYEKI